MTSPQSEVLDGAQHCVRQPLPGVVYPPQTDLDRYLDAGVLTRETLADGFADTARRYPDRIALKGPGLAMSYAELDSRALRLAAALLRAGLEPTDRVVFQLVDSGELVTGFLACLKAGLIPICTLAAHRESEIGYLARLAEAKAHLIQGDNPKFDDLDFARRMQAEAPTLRLILSARGGPAEGVLGMAALIEAMPLDEARAILSRVELDPFQVAVFQLSGGTTGVPKIIPRFGNEYLYNMRACAAWFGYAPTDVLFMPQPMVHNLNMGCCFGPMLLAGGTVTIAPDLRAETLIALMRAAPPTWAVLGGPIVARLEGAIRAGELDLSKARGVFSSNSAPKLRALLGVPVYHAFGLTEGCIMFTRPGDPPEVLDSTHGRPVSDWDEVDILVPGTERRVAPGEIGEPVFKGPYTIHGYYKAEERNREAFTSDGRYRSGDLMREVVVDGQRNFTFCGRLKDLVNRGGEKINCEEVERAVVGHPAIAAVLAVPYPDPVYDERLCACLILRDGQTAPGVKELGAFLQGVGLAKFKWPERIEIFTEFPLTGSGKPSRPRLRDEVDARIAAEIAAEA